MKPQDIIIVLVFIVTFSAFLWMNQKDNSLSVLLNQSKSAYVVMNYSGCEKTGIIVLCAAEVSQALGERNITVRPYVFDKECVDNEQKNKTIGECEKELLGLGFIIGCGEKSEKIVGNKYYYIGNEKEIRDCTIANKIKLS